MAREAPPYSLVLGVGVAALVLFAASSELRDVDVYWHLLAGGQLIRGISPNTVGSSWSFAPDSLDWVSTQWAAELVLFQVHRVASWGSLAAFRLLTAAIVLGVLARTTLLRRPVGLAAFPFLIAAVPMSLLSQERPQQITWVGAAVLGGVLVRGLEGGLPRWWLVLPGTVLWANLHGGWILVPAVLFLVTIGRFLDQGIGDAAGRRFAGLAAAALACGALTPSGLEGLATPLRFAQSTGHIIEWQATEPMTGPGLVTVLMLALVMIGWARPTRAPKSEFFVALILLAFSWTAWRNMVPALLLMAPLVARRLDLAFPSASRRAEPRWSAPLGIGIAVSALVLGLVSVAGREHLPMDEQPIRLAERLKDLGTEERVLNSYGVAGTTLYFGGPRIQVAIDGRADRYSPDYVDSYLDMFDLRGDWRGLLQELAPTSAIIKANTALAHYLVAEAGWVEVAKDGEYLLLREPAAAASPGTPPS